MARKMALFWAILSCLVLGWLFVACGLEEAAEEATEQDFDEDVELEPDPITLTNGKGVIEECGTTSVNNELDKVEDLADLDLDIDEIELLWIELKYRNASWTPSSITTIECQVTIEGSQGTATISEVGVNGASSDWEEVELTQDTIDQVNYYLAHRDEMFDYCASCSDEPDTFTAEFLLRLGVNIKGTVKVD